MITENFKPDLFHGKTVLVSGGSSGIGLQIARGFSQLGADVLASGSSTKKIEKLQHDTKNSRIKFSAVDVKKNEAVQSWVQSCQRIDVLINAQGIARPEAEWSEETFLEVMDVNLSSAFRLSMAALPKLQKNGGAILTVASMLSYLADSSVPAYTASKTGIVGLTRALAHKFGAKNVRVNALAPGYHRTDMTRDLWENEEDEKRIANRSALKRWGEADGLVGAAIFLCSDAASFITGAILPVDGGYHTG